MAADLKTVAGKLLDIIEQAVGHGGHDQAIADLRAELAKPERKPAAKKEPEGDAAK